MLIEQLFGLLLCFLFAPRFDVDTAVLQGRNVDAVLHSLTSNTPRSHRIAFRFHRNSSVHAFPVELSTAIHFPPSFVRKRP